MANTLLPLQEAPGSTPDWGTKISHAMQRNLNK